MDNRNDNNRNLILATVLSTLVLIVWYVLFPPPAAPPATDTAAQTAATASATTAAGTTAGTTAAATSSATTGAPQSPTQPATADPANDPRIAIDTPRLKGSINLLGGGLDDLSLKDYRETLDPASPIVRLLTWGTTGFDGKALKPYIVNFGWTVAPVPAGTAAPAAPPLPDAATHWTLDKGATLTPATPVTLAWDNGAGLLFRRTIAVDDSYMFTVTQSVENRTGAPVTLVPYGLVAREGAPHLGGTYVLHEGLIRMVDGKLLEVKYGKADKLDADPLYGAHADVAQAATGGWTGITDKYWMSTLIPEPGTPFTAVTSYMPERDNYIASARLAALTIAPGATGTSDMRLFAGAKEWETIKHYEDTLKVDRFVDSIDWGWFFFLTKPIFWLLHHLHGLIGNMGLAIIALTFIIKALVFPLARKSYISMAKMKELQPEMEKLKEQFGDDRAKVQQGMMALYKREKVNPASGCLPVLIQIPIFYSLYKVIYVTLELRQAPFFGWIRDLSAPDPSSILNLFGLLPWAAPDHTSALAIISLGVLPILLGISMWFQQKLNPAPPDPAQAQIFAWMPWIFMFMLGSFASGLVLYWIANNTITFLQQYTIMSMHGKRPDLFGNIREGFQRKKPAGK